MGLSKQFRRRPAGGSEEAEGSVDEQEEEEERWLALEEVKFLQKQRGRRGTLAQQLNPGAAAGAAAAAAAVQAGEKADGEGEKEELVLQDTFAQETAVTVEDPNMLKYIEQELSKKRGRDVDALAEDSKPAEDDLYIIPEHLKVKRRNAEESSTQWTTGIAEVQLPIEYKLKNIEETEAAKKQLQDKRPFVGRGRVQSSIPSSYSADYFQRGRDYADRLRREHPELYKDRKDGQPAPGKAGPSDPLGEIREMGNRRQAATDEIMLERFRKRERSRLLRR